MSIDHIHGGNIREVAGRHGLEPEEIIDFSASINPLGMSERARRAVINGLDSVMRYPEQFADTLASKISEFHEVPEECIIAGNGSTELIYLIPRAFRPKKALIIIPTFSEYKNSLEFSGCKTDAFLLTEADGFKVDVGIIAEALKNGYDILYLCNPGNPTGALTPKDTVLEITDEALKYRTICVVDEAFIDFAENESVKKEAVERPNLIVLRSMTKFFGIPGLRVGFALSSKGNIDRMTACKEPWSVNALGSLAAIESLIDMEYIEKSRRYITEERNYLFSLLAGVPWLKPFPSAANYILIKIELYGLNADVLFESLAKEGIMIRSCTSFDGLENRFFRVAVRKREENERLVNRLKLIF